MHQTCYLLLVSFFLECCLCTADVCCTCLQKDEVLASVKAMRGR